MHDFAIVKKIEGDRIFVVPLISNACIKCTTGCQIQGKMFEVSNKRKISLKKGDVVRLQLSKLQYAFNGMVSFLAPIASAIVGYIYSPAIIARVFRNWQMIKLEYLKFFTVSIFFFSASLIMFLISRSSLHFVKPEIAQTI